MLAFGAELHFYGLWNDSDVYIKLPRDGRPRALSTGSVTKYVREEKPG